MESASASPIQKIFTYQPPKNDQPQRYEKLRSKAKELAELIIEACPMSHERGIAIDKLRESIMWANSSIAVNE